MKLCFSTLGCPDWSWKEVVSSATDFGFPAVEIRGIADRIFAPDIPCFSDDKLEITKEKLASSGLSIQLLASNSALALDTNKDSENMDEAKEYIKLANKLGVPYIRVMPTKSPQPGICDLLKCAKLYEQLCEFGKEYNVMPLLETNSLLADSRVMSELMSRVNSDNKGVLWDIHHPFRYYGENPEETFSRIGSLVKHVHVKDSILKDGVNTYCMMGYGDIPVADCVRVLSDAGYDGCYSLEWVKRWNRELQEPAIVFAHYKYYMTNLIL